MMYADNFIDVRQHRVPPALVVAIKSRGLTNSVSAFMPRVRLEALLQVANDNGPAWAVKRRLAKSMLQAIDTLCAN